VQRASIPSRQAEAAAAERIARAVARRRLATGAAVALAAVGLGLGLWLGLSRDDRAVTLPMNAESVPRQSVPAPSPPVARQTTSVDPHQVVIDYDKFATRSAFVIGRQWEVTAGHHFANDTDKVWSRAWCYTRQYADGVLVQVDLAERNSESSGPRGPLASPASLARVGLDDTSALELASQCPWLDGRAYAVGGFDIPTGRISVPSKVTPSPDQSPEPIPTAPPVPAAPAYVARDGFDLPGNDLSNMPINADTQVDCESSCNSSGNCVAYVFNKPYKKCFLKNDIGTMFANDQAYTGYKPRNGIEPRTSLLQMHKQTGLIGAYYRGLDGTNYLDCTIACDKDSGCAGFNYDSSTKQCTMLKQVSSSIAMPTVASGLKSATE
jgi:PAN domain